MTKDTETDLDAPASPVALQQLEHILAVIIAMKNEFRFGKPSVASLKSFAEIAIRDPGDEPETLYRFETNATERQARGLTMEILHNLKVMATGQRGNVKAAWKIIKGEATKYDKQLEDLLVSHPLSRDELVRIFCMHIQSAIEVYLPKQRKQKLSNRQFSCHVKLLLDMCEYYPLPKDTTPGTFEHNAATVCHEVRDYMRQIFPLSGNMEINSELLLKLIYEFKDWPVKLAASHSKIDPAAVDKHFNQISQSLAQYTGTQSVAPAVIHLPRP